MTEVAPIMSSCSLSDARRQGLKILTGFSSTPDLDARLLLQAASGLRHEEMISEGDSPASRKCRELYNSYLQRRMTGEPVHRIAGSREFYGREFRVTEHTLLPRPETELLVQTVLEYSCQLSRGSRILDIGTGTGIIAISLALEGGFTNVKATDISMAALNVAQSNATLLGADDFIEFREEDALAGITGEHDVIVSNPPYISKHSICELDVEVKEFDPLVALDGGEDGLDFYRAIFSSDAILSPGGKFFIEVGFSQAETVSEICAASGFEVEDTKKDLSGIDRVLVIGRSAAEG